MPVGMTLVMNPKPLIVSVDDHKGKAFYGTAQHKEHVDSVVNMIKDDVDEKFEMIGMVTDNEETMRSLRRR